MRVTQSIAYRNFLSDLSSLNEGSNKALREISSGKKISSLRDSPSGCARLSSINALESRIDQYTSNAGDSSYFLQTADSALNEVNNLITGIHTRGSQAATGTIGASERAVLAGEVRSLRDQILSLANSQARGRYIFAGSLVSVAPFAIAGDTVTCAGNDDVNGVSVQQGVEVVQGVSGSEAFDAVFDAIEDLLAGMDANDPGAIENALGRFPQVFSGLGQVRMKIGANIGLLQNIQSSLETSRISLAEQKSAIEDADLAESVVELKRIQTALEAAISAGGSLLGKRNLFDIIG
ncbi:MAG: flagellar hook-associated protein FlgL [Acidobacteria bacterium]|nr:flagellar hook-associated protein FlgL [Acidobacteriota bacterium]